MLVGLGLSALVLGTIGFEQLESEHYGFFDSFYRAITLFAFGGVVKGHVPLSLQVARLLAPVLTGYAALGTILLLSREQAQILGIRLFARSHIIVAGLGASGSSLVLALDDRDMQVVVVESDPTNAHLAGVRARGVRVLIGDAADPAFLRRAGVWSARHVVALCGNDGTNVDVAAAVVACHGERPGLITALAATVGVSPATRRGVLTVFAHLGDLDLWRSLAEDAATFGSHPRDLRFEYFNVFATGGQMLLEHHPPFPPTVTDNEPRRPHILLVGLDAFGEQLVLRIARLWHSESPGPADQLRITLAGASAEEELSRLRDRYPQLERYCALGSRPSPIESAAFQSGRAMLGDDGACDVTRAYVCIEDEGDALTAALALHAAPDAVRVPVAVAVADARAGVATVLAAEGGRFANITPFGLLTAATSPQLLLRGVNEVLARAKHDQYVRDELRAGRTGKDRHMRPWEELEESEREDNREFADGIGEKLTDRECILVPMSLRDPDEPPFAFTDEEVELLAHQEHMRWMKAKHRKGWKFGRPRNDDLKIHDQLVDWEQLDERNRNRDREAIRQLPSMLELTGFRIQRCTPGQRSSVVA